VQQAKAVSGFDSGQLKACATKCRWSQEMSEMERGNATIYDDLGLEHAKETLVRAQPSFSNLLRGQFCGISGSKMLECLTRQGRNVEINARATHAHNQQDMRPPPMSTR
jgi:Helix-turn-helix domain